MVSFNLHDRYRIERQKMIQQHLRGRDIHDIRILEAFERIPRELFVPEKYAASAYDDNPLPIGMGQTISQPYIVALMTQQLELSGTERILEIGTGSGYQTAILAELAGHVYTVERFSELSENAQAVLARLDFCSIDFAVADGSCGWPEKKEFDRIIVTAAVPEIPAPLKDQLAENGLIVAPVSGTSSQELVAVRKYRGNFISKAICGCRFVKLIGRYGYPE